MCVRRLRPFPTGVVTLPFSVREGINIFLAGFVPTENLRFRDEALTFKVGCGCCGPVLNPKIPRTWEDHKVLVAAARAGLVWGGVGWGEVGCRGCTSTMVRSPPTVWRTGRHFLAV